MPDLPAQPLTVWTLPPVWGTPAPSPFVIKLLLWLRMAKIPHRLEVLQGPPRSPTGKIPYVTLPDGTMLHDSGLILAELGRRFSIDLDRDLSPIQRATGHAVRRMVEEHLYFVGAWERWTPPEARAVTVRDYFAHLPPGIRQIAGWMAWRGMRANLHGQGLGRLTPEQIRAAGRADVQALAHLFVGPYFLGPPSTVDATVAAFLWALSASPIANPVQAALRDQAELTTYVDRMKQEFFA